MKRAMSPLFSTIVLIGFAIALGGIVMSWGKSGYAIERTPTGCEKASLELVSYGETKGICVKDNKLFFTIENNGEVDLAGIKISAIGDEGIYSAVIEENVKVADILKSNIEFKNIGRLQKATFVPKYILLSQEKLCPKSGFSIEEIGECK